MKLNNKATSSIIREVAFATAKNGLGGDFAFAF